MSQISTPASNSSAPITTPATAVKLRSCVVCRTRKVRCDKQSPCSNCSRAKIACVFPSNDRPPRWARRLERVANNAALNAQASQEPDPAAAQVMERLRYLESLVKELSGKLEVANAAASSAAGGSSSGVGSPESSSQDHNPDYQTNAGNIQNQFGRLVIQDGNRSRYVSSGFWSRVNDELDGLQMDHPGVGADDSDSSEDEVPLGKASSTQELQRTPSERHGFLFGHNLISSAPDIREFHPLPSQIPFLLDVFSENVNSVVPIVHTPTVKKIVRDMRNNMTSLTPANEALMFSIYYAAINSMEEDDIMTNFGRTKSELNLKYRIGLEHALAKADFLNVPDLVLVQAFSIFIALARRHDSPRFVWMMTGLAIRMGQALGLQRDGVHFKHLTPFEVEMRRRLWWTLHVLDVRASEDQGTDFTIALGSFDTKLPLNINDADIEPESTEAPAEREGMTDSTFALVTFEVSNVARKMMAQSAKDGAPDIEEQGRLVEEIYQKVDRRYLQYSVEPGNVTHWVAVMVARLVMAKMTLLVYLPILFSSTNEHFSDRVKNKLLVAATECAEYNHALNAEKACRHWRWVYQTYTHWYAVVYLLIECSRRPWSPIIERAWVALHSEWLIPAQSSVDKNQRMWVPLRKLTAKARRHRNSELERLRNDPQAAEKLEMDDQKIPVPASPGPFPSGSNVPELFRERWRQFLKMPRQDTRKSAKSQPRSEFARPSAPSTQPSAGFIPAYSADVMGFDSYLGAQSDSEFANLQPAPTPYAPNDFATDQTAGPLYNTTPADSAPWSLGPGFVPWLWADADPTVDVFANVNMDEIDINMDSGSDMDWYGWVESANKGGMDWDAGRQG